MPERPKRDLLADELRQAVGEDPIHRAPAGAAATLRSARPLLTAIGVALLAVGVLASLSLGSWVCLGVAVLVYALVSGVVVGSALVLAREDQRPRRRPARPRRAGGESPQSL